MKGLSLRRIATGHGRWLVAVLVSDLVTIYSFPPHRLGPLMLVGLVPLFWALDTAPSAKAAALRAWVYAFVCNAAICAWVARTAHDFANLPWVLSVAGLLVLSVFEQIAWPAMALLRFVVSRWCGGLPLFWSAALLVILETIWPKMFPNTMGNVFYDTPVLRQIADLGSVAGLTALVVASNEAAAGLLRRESRTRAGFARFALTAAVVLLLAGYGEMRYLRVRRAMGEPIGHLPVALIQPGLNPLAYVRGSFNVDYARMQAAVPLFALSGQALSRGPRLFFWPETAIAGTYHSPTLGETAALTRAIDELAYSTRVPVLFGARELEDGRLYNTLYLVSRQGEGLVTQKYRKRHLLFFGEWLPGVGAFPSLASRIGEFGVTLFSSGPGPVVFRVGDWALGPMICLEGLYAGYVAAIVRQGVDVLVNATNDAWFGEGEPELHLALTRFRAIETRRPLVRATTTGYSAIVDIDGSLRAVSDWGRPASLVEEVPIYPRVMTPFARWGRWEWLAAVLWAVMGPAIRRWRAGNRRPA
jgi:apolipoprotein N-acyltransferase